MEASLRWEDVVALSKAVDGKLDINSREVFPDPKSKIILKEVGAIDEKGVLTSFGKDIFDKAIKAEERLKIGIPYETRKTFSEKRAYMSTRPWHQGKIKSIPFFSNGELLAVGAPMREMEASKIPDAAKKKLTEKVIKVVPTECTKQMWPHTFQIEALGSTEVVWLSNEAQSLFIPVQAKYFDYVNTRFPKSKYFASVLDKPVIAKIDRKGIDGIVAIIAPLNSEALKRGGKKPPEKRKGWRDEKMQDKRVPSDKED
jgi:hypothetical protein